MIILTSRKKYFFTKKGKKIDIITTIKLGNCCSLGAEESPNSTEQSAG